VNPPLRRPTGIAVQFRYGFVTDADGLKVLASPISTNRRWSWGTIPLADARNISLSRTYAYIVAGREGMPSWMWSAPSNRGWSQDFSAPGEVERYNDIKIGMVASGHTAGSQTARMG